METVESLSKKIESLERQLNETQAVSRQYLQNVAHQLTAPIGAIKWSIEALRDERVPLARKQTLMRSVYSQSTILVHVIKNFTLMSNLEADHELGQFREQPEPTDIRLLAINLVNDFQPQAYERGITIDVNDDSFDKTYRDKLLEIEKNLVAQALSNVIENAVKYADPDSKIEVRAWLSTNCIGLVVESQGIPISPSDTKRIFERGFRGTSAQQSVAAGTGFGLYLASRIMDFHHGSIFVEPKGRRSSFKMEFPKSRLIG